MKKTKILIVEDEWIIGNDLKDNLEMVDYEVTNVVAAGEQAIQNVKENKPDIVLMDIMLQGDMDGIETADKMQKFEKIPVIFLTAHSDNDTLNRAKMATPFGYLVKPVRIREAQIVIEMAISKHESDRRLIESEEWFSTTLSSIADGVITTDTNGLVTFLNPVSLSLLDIKSKDAIGKHFCEIVQILDNETNKKVDCLTTSVIREAKLINFIDHVLVNKQGRKIPISNSVAPIKNTDKDILGVVFVFSDISERKRIEKEREELISQREKALKQVKVLQGLLPICAACKNIRDDKGSWKQLEEYILKHSEANFTHSMCPDCLKIYYPEIYNNDK